MRSIRHIGPVVYLSIIVIFMLSGSSNQLDSQPRDPDLAPYIPTPQEVVNRMLELAEVTTTDIVYDLGSGDGRIPITAAKRYGARGVGIDFDPQRIAESNANARREGVTDRVEFILGDVLQADVSEATVVTLYLLSSSNIKLRPILTRQLSPGTRIVSHAFDMGDWLADRIEIFKDYRGNPRTSVSYTHLRAHET